jgi:hypothetical protein
MLRADDRPGNIAMSLRVLQLFGLHDGKSASALFREERMSIRKKAPPPIANSKAAE